MAIFLYCHRTVSYILYTVCYFGRTTKWIRCVFGWCEQVMAEPTISFDLCAWMTYQLSTIQIMMTLSSSALWWCMFSFHSLWRRFFAVIRVQKSRFFRLSRDFFRSIFKQEGDDYRKKKSMKNMHETKTIWANFCFEYLVPFFVFIYS